VYLRENASYGGSVKLWISTLLFRYYWKRREKLERCWRTDIKMTEFKEPKGFPVVKSGTCFGFCIDVFQKSKTEFGFKLTHPAFGVVRVDDGYEGLLQAYYWARLVTHCSIEKIKSNLTTEQILERTK
jgi:hypothetical protein